MRVVVGLDCGGSSCRAWAINLEGVTVFQGQSGPTNLLSTPESRLRRHLGNALRGCPQVEAVCGCFAGLVNDFQRDRAVGLLREFFPTAAIRAEPDYAAAFRASNDGTNVCVIAGTGSLVCSWANGRFVRSGGRGYILGDAGSAFAYGRDALVHYLDGPTPPSRVLATAVETVFGLVSEGELVAALYQSPSPAGTLAKLAKALGEDALAGEPYAQESVSRNTELLTGILARHVDQWQIGPELAVCLTGGIWKASQYVRAEFEAKVRARVADRVISIERTFRPPVHGAVEMAREMLNGN